MIEGTLEKTLLKRSIPTQLVQLYPTLFIELVLVQTKKDEKNRRIERILDPNLTLYAVSRYLNSLSDLEDINK